MGQDSSADADSVQASVSASRSDSSYRSGKNKHLLKWVIIVAAVIVVALIASSFIPSSYPKITQTASANSTPIYMSATQAQALLQSPLSTYNTYDVYNDSSPINMSYLISVIPQLYGNATSGWITFAAGSNSTSNASIIYMEITTNHTENMSSAIGNLITSSLNITPAFLNNGTENGLNYTYGLYQNSTGVYQILYGWEHNNTALAYAAGNPGFLVNETSLIEIAANDTPG